MVPAHESFKANNDARGEIHDGLVVHHQLVRLEGAAKLLDEREAADSLLVHAGAEEHGLAALLSLRHVEGDVGILDELSTVGALRIPHHDANARVLFEAQPAERERFSEYVEESVCDLLGFLLGGQPFS